jgi:hypothetical protein
VNDQFGAFELFCIAFNESRRQPLFGNCRENPRRKISRHRASWLGGWFWHGSARHCEQQGLQDAEHHGKWQQSPRRKKRKGGAD